MNSISRTALCASAVVLAGGAASAASVLTFSDISGVAESPAGYVSNGVAFTVTSSTGDVGVYDTSVLSPVDPDLTSPFVDADGILEDRSFGNAIVANENDTTPDDQAGGAELLFSFEIPLWLTYIDVLDPEEGADVYVNGVFVGEAETFGPGKNNTSSTRDNFFDRVSFANTLVSSIEVRFSGSGAVGEIGAVPIPAAFPLLLGGFGALAMVRRRRKTA